MGGKPIDYLFIVNRFATLLSENWHEISFFLELWYDAVDLPELPQLRNIGSMIRFRSDNYHLYMCKTSHTAFRMFHLCRRLPNANSFKVL
jgi:hypothetical protein